MKSNLAEACPGVEMGGRGAEAYQVTEAGERRAVLCPGNYVTWGVGQTVCFKLNLAEACSGIDAGEGGV